MRRIGALVLALGVLLSAAAPGVAWAGGRGHHHSRHGVRTFVYFGPTWWGPPYWYYPPAYYYAYPPQVVVREPPVYIQQQPAHESPPPMSVEPSVPAEPAETAYWYYCPTPDASGYYPTVPTCAEAWVKVPPRRD